MRPFLLYLSILFTSSAFVFTAAHEGSSIVPHSERSTPQPETLANLDHDVLSNAQSENAPSKQSIETLAEDQPATDLAHDELDKEQSENPPSKQSTDTLAKNQPATDLDHDELNNVQSDKDEKPLGFELEFLCYISDTYRCNKAEETYMEAFNILDMVLDIKQRTRVQTSFRELVPICDTELRDIERTIKYDSHDGKTYVYPKALHRQLRGTNDDLPDIVLEINSNCPFYFSSDERPIQPNEMDALIYALRQLIHGLGFWSSWECHYGSFEGLSPWMRFEQKTDGSFFLAGFHETIADQFLVETVDSTSISEYTSPFRAISLYLKQQTTVYKDKMSLVSAIESLPAYQENSNFMLNLLAKPLSIAFRNKDGSQLILNLRRHTMMMNLETKLYLKTPEFLMIADWDAFKGVSLKYMIKKTGGVGPIGPFLIKMLETLGYTVRKEKFPLESFNFWGKPMGRKMLRKHKIVPPIEEKREKEEAKESVRIDHEEMIVDKIEHLEPNFGKYAQSKDYDLDYDYGPNVPLIVFPLLFVFAFLSLGFLWWCGCSKSKRASEQIQEEHELEVFEELPPYSRT